MEQMSSWGFDACAAESGDEGYRVLETATRMGIDVDCVILDYQMPGMNGTDVARLVRANPALAHSPMIMLTSVDQSLSSSLARDLGIETQLIKPARSSMLLDAIVTTIQRRRSLSQAPAAETRPAAEVAAQKPAAQRRRKAQVEPACIDILVAEDNEVNQLVFRQILGETDYTFEIVDNGSLAVDSFETLRPRMVLMDVSMPVMGGLEATAEIRRREAADGTHVPIVGVTAHALKGDRERCLQAGMDDYLPKPISPNALLSKVDLWLAVTDSERTATA
jgi:CheY-like chemotaxis protein